MPPPPERPGSRTLPAIPRVQREHETERPPQSDSPDREKVLRELRAVEERAKVQLDAVSAGLRDQISQLEAELEARDRRIKSQQDELDEFKRRSRADDQDRDDRLERLRKRDEELATRLEELTRPRTEATATSAAATVINAARRREFWEKVLWALAVVILYVWQLASGRSHVEPTESIPIPTVQTPNPSNPAGRPDLR